MCFKENDNKLKALIATDADNTLWDTNSIYAEGQLCLLEKIENDLGAKYQAKDRLEFVRSVDQELVRLHNYNLKYPLELLVLGVSNCIKGMSAEKAAIAAINCSHSVISDKSILKHAKWFTDHILFKKPQLRPGVSESIKIIYELGLKIIVLTEGHEKRCRMLIDNYKLNKYIEEIIVGRKTIDLYKKIFKYYDAKKSFMIGDQMDRDILMAKKSGFITIYFKGGFQPQWLHNDDFNMPDHQIKTFITVPEIVNRYIVGKSKKGKE